MQNNTLSVEILTGFIERITFHNEENGFCVLRVKVKRFKDLVTVLGHLVIISVGEYVTATGVWLNDKTHGIQFKASHLKSSVPTSLEGIEKYLGSGLIQGIGPTYAKKLIQHFGEQVFDIIAEAPERLYEVEGVGKQRAQTIITSWNEQKTVREIMLFLHDHKISTARAVRIYNIYGEQAIKIISENPYKLARDIRGIGFLGADQIAINLGIDINSIGRARAGIDHVLLEYMDNGHTGMHRRKLLEKAETLLKIDIKIIEEALALGLKDQALEYDIIKANTIDYGYDPLARLEAIFLSGLYHIERNIASRLKDYDAQQDITMAIHKCPFCNKIY